MRAMMNRLWLACALGVLAGCVDGSPGEPGTGCTVRANDDGSRTVVCADGTSVTLRDGADGQDGADAEVRGCEAVDTGDGTLTIDCGEGRVFVVSQAGAGAPRTPHVLHGDYMIFNSLDAEALQGVTEITGSLGVPAAGLSTLALPALTAIGGRLTVSGQRDLTTLRLPALVAVGELLLSSNARLEALDLRSLTTVDRQLLVLSNPQLPACVVEALVQQVSAGEAVANSQNREGCTCEVVAGLTEATCP